MNMFAIDIDPVKAAIQLHNRHIVKMILESAQMLSTTRIWYGDSNPVLYKSCFEFHPCTIWVRKSLSNYIWLLEHFKVLCQEYTFRYLKIHGSQNLLEAFNAPFPKPFLDFGLTSFAITMPEEFVLKDPIQSYRFYYLNRKISGNFWTKRSREDLDPWLSIHLQDFQFRN